MQAQRSQVNQRVRAKVARWRAEVRQHCWSGGLWGARGSLQGEASVQLGAMVGSEDATREFVGNQRWRAELAGEGRPSAV